MTSDPDPRPLQHDLRDALSAVQMNLQTLEALEGAGQESTSGRRLAIIGRAKLAVAEAVRVAEQMRVQVSEAEGKSE